MLRLSVIILSLLFANTGINSDSTQTFGTGKSGINIFSELYKDFVSNTNGTIFSNDNLLEKICLQAKLMSISDPVCSRQISIICKNKEILLKMLDATSKFSGMLYGSRKDYGNFDECINIDYSYENETILGKYCPFVLLLPDLEKGYSDWKKVYKLSVCLPSGCPLKIFSKMLNKTYLDESLDKAENSCVTKETGKILGLEALMIITAIGFWFGFILICTFYDIYLYIMERGSNSKVEIFSLLANAKKLLNTKSSPNSIQAFDGLRVISLAWIIGGHGYGAWNEGVPSANEEDPYQNINKYYTTFINAGHMAVDTFFFISGFLVAYNYLKKFKPLSSQLKSIPSFYLHRYIRLTVSVGIMYLIGVWIFPHAGTGPLWYSSSLESSNTCKKYWWSFFLYIQNYYNYKELCYLPSWYLSADMQMFLLSPLILIPLSIILNKRMNLRMAMVGLGTLAVILATFPVTINYLIDYQNLVDTHTRLINYFMGITMGFVTHKINGYEYLPFIPLKKVRKFNLIIWSMALLLMLSVVLLYQPADVSPNGLFKTVFLAVARPVWCIGLSWIVYSCHNGYGGIVNWILTRPVMKVLSKMSYPMYILHLFIIGHFLLNNQVRLYYSDYVEFYLFCGYYIETVFFSVLWALVFEFPILSMEKELRRKKKGIVNWILTRPVMKVLSKMSYPMYILHLFIIGHFLLNNQVRLYYSDYVEFYLFCGYYIETVFFSVLWALVFEFPILSMEKELRRKKKGDQI